MCVCVLYGWMGGFVCVYIHRYVCTSVLACSVFNLSYKSETSSVVQTDRPNQVRIPFE